MKNVFNYIPRWNKIYCIPVQGKDRLIKDACYNTVAALSANGHRIYQIRFRDHECEGECLIEIKCSRYTFHYFLQEFKARTKKYVWAISKVR